MKAMTPKSYRRFIIDTAEDAGIFLRKNIGNIKTIAYKARANIVTDIDKRCESRILRKIRKAFPEHAVLSEEAGESGKRNSEYLWLIDPLDGTTNYAHGFNFFCVSIALMKKGVLIASAVYDPVRSELFSAARNSGAFLNGRRIKVSSVRSLDKALLSTGFPYRLGKAMRINIRNFTRFMFESQAVRRPGSAALDLCYVACGRFDGFWEMELHPWDTAAGVLIVEEAGGRVTDFHNNPFNPFTGQILATNRLIHKRMTGILR